LGQSDDSADFAFVGYIEAGTETWKSIRRGIFLFDTSSLDDEITITKATISLYGYGTKVNTLGDPFRLNIYASAPASDTAVVNGDYNSLGTTALSDTAILFSAWDDAGWNDFALNPTGLAAISKTDITKLGTRESVYDATDTEPTWGASKQCKIQAVSADAGGANIPKLVVEFTGGSGSVYRSAVAWTPTVVLEDGVRLTEVASEIAVNSSGEWYSDGAYLYIQCSDDAAPSTHTIEAGRRDTAIAINAKSYITLDGITTSGGNTYGGMFIWTNSAASSNVTVQNCTIRNATGHGINVTNAHETHKTTDILINGNTVHGNGSTGINVGDGVNTLTISKNTVYANNVDLANYNAGIRVNPVDGVDGTDTVIEYNKVYGNLLVGNSKWQQGNGIHIDYTASGAVVRYNEVYDNESVGIFIEASDTAEVYGNLSYGNTDEGVLVYRYEGGCLVYNNSSYGNGTGIGIRGEDA